jgi:nucleotide-binding universal stress UspA family protein
MSLVVPFDGSPLSKAALVRAVQFETVLDEDESFDAETVASRLRAQTTELAPDATFHPVFVGKHSPSGTIALRIRRFAQEHDASILFVGSENAGRLVSSVTVGRTVAGDRSYDTFIVSNERPPEIGTLEAEVSAEELLP